MIGVLAIGGDVAWRAWLRRVLALRTDLHWLGAHAAGAPRPAQAGQAELLLLDGDDPGVERGRRRRYGRAPRRLYFFAHPDLQGLRRCLREDTAGCLGKDATVDALLRALRAADAGLFVLPPQLLRDLLLAPGVTGMPADPTASTHWQSLTLRQREIVACLSEGLSNKQIARRLGISPETVKSHLRNVFEREGVHGRAALLAAARRESDGVPSPQ